VRLFASIDPDGRHRRAGDGLTVIFELLGLIIPGA